MSRIVFADDGIEFDGSTPDKRPLGGAESSLILLCECLAARGHDVSVHNRCASRLTHKGVKWEPLRNGLPETCDLYVANRGDNLILRMPNARRTVFWTHNPASYMVKWRYLWKLWKRKPAIIFIGDYHAATYPGWAPGGERVVIPYGLPDEFCEAAPVKRPSRPRAIFTSNPLRGLDWLLDRWTNEIFPRTPEAELHLFAGAKTYGAAGGKKAETMNAVLDKAGALADKGVVLRDPIPKRTLIDELRRSRVMLYRGDVNETFCMSVGEAQALGLPCVLRDIGSMRERVRHGETGYVTATDAAFSDAAVSLLMDDSLWERQHMAALEKQRLRRWPEAAEAWERLIP